MHGNNLGYIQGRFHLVSAFRWRADAFSEMPIPDFDRNGLLPAGVFDCTMEEIHLRFTWNDHRTRLYGDFSDFVNHELRREFPDPFYCDGSFITDKDLPQDVDVVLDLHNAPDGRKWKGVLFKTLEGPRIFSNYRIDFWVNLPGMNDFSAFFQYVGVKTAKFKGLDPLHHKGILRVF